MWVPRGHSSHLNPVDMEVRLLVATAEQRSSISTQSFDIQRNAIDLSPWHSKADINNSSVQMTNEAINVETAFKESVFKSFLNEFSAF